jgi:regulation of enolase protein 1 (concanavalin A-like superfamily)
MTTNATASAPVWTRIQTPTDATITHIAIGADPSLVYVTQGSFGSTNVIRTTNGGATWTDGTGAGDTGLPEAPAYDLQFDPVDANTIYAATEVGVFTSRDAGTTWDLPQDGPANVCVEQLFWMGRTLIAVTHGRGLFAYDTTGGGTSDPGSGDGGGGSSGSLPAPWTSTDVGAVGKTGRASFANGTFAVSGAGADVWGNADAFQFVHRTLDGDGTITARVASIQGSASWTKAGVMMRASTSPDAAQAFMLVSAGKGLAFQRRPSNGAATVNTSGGAGTAPAWVRLSRTGDVVVASASPDGSTWTEVGRESMTWPSSLEVGLAVSSHTTTATATAGFDHVDVTTVTAGLPSGWTTADIGAVGAAGSATASGGTFTVAGAGADVWGTADAFRFTYRPLAGDGSIVARVATVQNVAAWTKAGVMIRQSLDAGSAQAFMLVSAGKGLAFQRRAASGGSSTSTTPVAGTAPKWVRLDRQAQTITAYASADGASWTRIGQDVIGFSGTVWAGLAVSSHVAGTTARAAFDAVSITGTAAPAAAWQDADVGAVGVRGSSAVSGSTVTVAGGGADVWDAADAFHFRYAPLTGDGEIVARVAAIAGSQRWTKAGVMIRASLDPASAYAFMLVSAAKGTAWQFRAESRQLAQSIAGSAAAPPRWVRIVRAGGTLTGYESNDGATWSSVGAAPVALGATPLIGLAVTSHDVTRLATATFDNIQ